jgi:ribose transport system ATP-binding protein
VLGVTGLLGSGIEELPYCLFGVNARRRGDLKIRDRCYDIQSMTPERALVAGIGLVPNDRQQGGSIGTLAVGDNLMLHVLHKYGGGFGIKRRRLRNDAAAMLGRFQVRPPDPTMEYKSLSGGNQQKVMLAKWLQLAPTFLILHEPTQGVDIGARQEIFRLIRGAGATGTAILCVSTDYDQLASICDRVLVFADGTVTRELTRDEITKQRIADQVYSRPPDHSGVDHMRTNDSRYPPS